MNQQMSYGQGDTTFIAVGGENGVRSLVNQFYDRMSSDPQYQTIRSWHPDDITESRDKLTLFLCGWMGGSRSYRSKYGSINILKVHQHLKVTAVERDQWLNCMADILAKSDYPDDLIEYLISNLSIPAERIRQNCSKLAV